MSLYPGEDNLFFQLPSGFVPAEHLERYEITRRTPAGLPIWTPKVWEEGSRCMAVVDPSKVRWENDPESYRRWESHKDYGPPSPTMPDPDAPWSGYRRMVALPGAYCGKPATCPGYDNTGFWLRDGGFRLPPLCAEHYPSPAPLGGEVLGIASRDIELPALSRAGALVPAQTVRYRGVQLAREVAPGIWRTTAGALALHLGPALPKLLPVLQREAHELAGGDLADDLVAEALTAAHAAWARRPELPGGYVLTVARGAMVDALETWAGVPRRTYGRLMAGYAPSEATAWEQAAGRTLGQGRPGSAWGGGGWQPVAGLDGATAWAAHRWLTPTSLDAALDPEDDEGGTFHDLPGTALTDEQDNTYEDGDRRSIEAHRRVHDILDRLPAEDADLLRMAYGIEGEKLTQKEISRKMTPRLSERTVRSRIAQAELRFKLEEAQVAITGALEALDAWAEQDRKPLLTSPVAGSGAAAR